MQKSTNSGQPMLLAVVFSLLYTAITHGSTMNSRKVSSSADKSPAVDIDIERSNDHGELVTQKIHFTKR